MVTLLVLLSLLVVLSLLGLLQGTGDRDLVDGGGGVGGHCQQGGSDKGSSEHHLGVW